jgi:glycosyltransferase involved in cell wall biosynthesis
MARGIEPNVTPEVSVVVPTRNRAGFLSRLLAALAEQDCSSLEVIVVDDASTDETPRILEAWEGEGRVAVRLDRPTGSYGARNVGWRAARGAVVAFTDDDCVPDRGWIAGLVRALDADAVGAQGMTLAEGGEITPFTHQIEQRRPGPPYRTCNIAYRREALERVGGFDESFRWYGDNILGLRVRQTGEIAWAPEAVLRHPPRPRQWRTRDEWLARFDADARHRAILHDLGVEPISAPRGLLPVVLWVLRPLVKQSGFHLRYAARNPRAYLRGLGPMLAEKRALIAAMRAYYRGPRCETTALPPLSKYPSVSVVVVTRDRPGYLRNVLAALDRQTWPHRSIVVNNGAGPVEVPHGVEVVEAAGSRLSEARQRGLEAAGGEIVAFTDDDCLPASDWLERMVAAFRTNPALRGVQGRTVAGAGPIGAHTVRVERPNRLYQTCNIAYRREALARAGGFDTAFDGWFEDTALAARVLEDGPIGFARDAVVIHTAVPRRPFNVGVWRRVIADERRLAERYPRFYRRTRGPMVGFAVIGRWLVGSPVKTAAGGRPRRLEEIPAYARLLLTLLRERRDLLRALLSGA